MHGSMEQAPPVHFAADFAAYDPIGFIDDIKYFLAHSRLPVSWANCCRLTASARTVGDKPALLKARVTACSGQICFSNLNIILRRWENACLTILTNVDSADKGTSGSGRLGNVVQAESISGSGKKHEAGILKWAVGSYRS